MTTTEAKRVYLQNENDEILLPYSSQAIEDGDGNVISDTYLKKVDAATSFNSKLNTDVSTNISAAGKSYVSGLGLPNLAKYKDLNLGATGSTYTAPANGWVVFGKQSTDGLQHVLLSKDNNPWSISWAAYSQWNLFVYIPVKKGEIFRANYTAGGATQMFRFYYAEGDAPESEA